MSAVETIPAPLARFFPGVCVETILDKYPIYPLDAPGMPTVGPDFVRDSVASGDEIPLASWTKPDLLKFVMSEWSATCDEFDEDEVKKLKKLPKEKVLKLARVSALPYSYLETTHRAALYSPRFSLTVRVGQGDECAKFLSGHLGYSDAPYGPSPAPAMIIGKHPGREDLSAMRNFVGPYSEDLFNVFKDLHIDDETWASWYYTNLIKHQNLDPDKDAISAEWVRNCLPLLQQELRLVKPKVVLCLGADAAKAMLGRGTKITNTIGRIYDMEIPIHRSEDEPEMVHKFKLICCTHPARIAREPELYDKPEFMGAIRLFADLVAGTRETIDEKDLVREYLFTEKHLSTCVDKILEETPKEAAIAFDAEWHGEYPWEEGAYLRTIQFSHKAKFGAAIVLTRPGGEVNKDMPVAAVLREMNRLLAASKTRKVRIIGHNFKADMVWLRHIGLDLTRLYYAAKHDPAPGANGRLFGFEKTKTEGGFDTMLAAHAVSEMGPFKLEVLASQHLGTPRYDVPLMRWKTEYCKLHKMKQDALVGYGDVPEDILLPYGCYDADVTRRLYDTYNGIGEESGLLDYDRFGNSCREPFWISQRANPAAFEIETVGIPVDRKEVERLTNAFAISKTSLLMKLRAELKWPEFNPESPIQRKEMLFGEQYGKIDKATGKAVRSRPDGAISLKLIPLATTLGRPWAQKGPKDLPSTDKTTICTLAPKHPIVQTYRDLRFVGQTLKTVLRPPNAPEPGAAEDEEPEYEKGLMSFVSSDGRVRTHIFPVETGRWSSSRPNLMNYSSRRDADYKRILGKDVFKPLRYVFTAPPGYVIIEADYTGAELAVAAWLSQDPKMMEHVKRMQLPEDHPDFYDIHSNIAVTSFGLTCPPTKEGLEKAGLKHLRIAAKRRIFGYMYGQGDAAALMQIHEEGALNVTIDDVRRTTAGIRSMYGCLDIFFNDTRQRPHSPGWICSPFGRYYRFHTSRDQKRMADQERESMNRDIQGTVADAMSTSMGNFIDWRDENPKVKFDIALQIHDAVLMIVPTEHAAVILEEAIPECMTKRVPIWPCNLDGIPIAKKPEYLATDRKVGLRWGEQLTVEQAKAFGVPLKYARK